jgi:restriction system protein
MTMRSWLIRLGKFGEMEPHALQTGELVTGWQLGDLKGATTKEAILPIVTAADSDRKPGTLSNWAVQLNQFLNVIAQGDLMILPMKTTGQLAIGEVIGDWFQTPEGSPARRVKWLRTDLPRQAVKQDLLFSLGATQTVAEISRNEAPKRFLVAAQKGQDPGPTLGAAPSPKTRMDNDSPLEEGLVDLGETARDQIERYISAHYAGHAFTQLIAAILRAQGYQARVSPPGADKGVDIVAGQGALGFDGPRLVVQVKSGDLVVDQPTLQGLIGCVADTHAEHGLLVAWSGFKSPVRQRVNELYFRVRLWDRQDILDALFSVYERLPEEIRAELPLRRIWTIVPEENDAS